ncbi:GTP-binding protein [Paracoccus sp. Z118]|uniref:GNAT family N-acetyltransferase n=1 Tax=Paracoccus sp. Z118 TaxID=2851017 RepID=UPI001C2C4E67|nr:GNAT family N-acetyltransferase [Paracoccus sp. Z118]MBV0890773.1 GTP-binding protein [Paracoccus sp. Z118]
MNRQSRHTPLQLRLVRPLPLAVRADAARLIAEEFGREIAPWSDRRTALVLIRRGLRRERIIAALDGQGRLVGLTGLRGPRGGALALPRGRAAAALDRVLGLAAPRTADLVLDCLVVSPGWRGRGVAALLIAAALTEAERRGHPGLRAEVARRNAPALAAFRRAGFAPQRGWPGGARVLRLTVYR